MSAEQSLISGNGYLGGLLGFSLQAVRNYLVMVIALPLLVTALAFVIARQLPPVYGAQASIRIGRVDGTDLLSPQAAASRINSQPFRQRMLQTIKLPREDYQSVGVSARPETSDTIVVGARASTTQQVQRILDVTVQLLNDEQERVAGPLLSDIKEQLASNDANIASLLQARDSLSGLAKGLEAQSGDAASTSYRAVWLLDLSSRVEQRLTNARAERYALASRLGSWKTYPTAIVDGAFVSSAQVSPRTMAIAGIAGVLTLLGCILFALLRHPRNIGVHG